MNCDLCNRSQATDNQLCSVCAEMIRRLVVVNERINTREVCEAERPLTIRGCFYRVMSSGFVEKPRPRRIAHIRGPFAAERQAQIIFR